MVDLFERLEGLAKLSDELNAESDGINELIEKVSDHLRALNLGVTGSAFVESQNTTWFDEDEKVRIPCERRVYLEWKRGDRREWECQIAEVWARDGSDSFLHESVTPLTSADRSTRIAALEKMPDLVGDIEKVARQKLETLKAAKEALS